MKKTLKIRGVTVNINIGKDEVVHMKIDGPNKKIEKEVGESMITLLNETSKITNGHGIKVLKKGFTK